MDGALNAVLACPRHHLFRFVARLDRAQAHLTEQAHPGFRQFLEVLFEHAFFDHGRTRQNLDTPWPEVVKRTLRRDGEGLQANNVFGPAWQVNFAGRNHGGHTAMHGRINPADLVLARRPVPKHRMYMAVNQPRANTRLVCINHGLRVLDIAILKLAHGHNQPVIHHDGVGIQYGFIDITGQQQADIPDHDFSGLSGGCSFCHGAGLSRGFIFMRVSASQCAAPS